MQARAECTTGLTPPVRNTLLWFPLVSFAQLTVGISLQNLEFVGFVSPAIKNEDSRLVFVSFVRPATIFEHPLVSCRFPSVTGVSGVISLQNLEFVGFVSPAIKNEDSRLVFVSFVSPATIFEHPLASCGFPLVSFGLLTF